ncbi:MAG: ABC transporter ATP-binding protein, partial [Pirellulales bacterium]|nr:ABC transporter ATP-binding protein [Pirellulales bacterium]
MIEFDRVTRTFGRKVAVKDLSLTVESGELYALLGRNGAGKTTTIKMLVGLLRPDRGVVRVRGIDVAKATEETNQFIGYVPDEPHLYDKLTGREFLRFVAEMYGMKDPEITNEMERQIEQFQLKDFVDQLTESYSHGMKQRTVFAAVLIHDPPVLVVDEPMIGLDPHSARLVKDLLKKRAATGATVLISTHTLSAAEEVASRIGVMDNGRLLFDGT